MGIMFLEFLRKLLKDRGHILGILTLLAIRLAKKDEDKVNNYKFINPLYILKDL
jgi:hypothetical protein